MPFEKPKPFPFHLTAAKLFPLWTWHAPMECIRIFWHFAFSYFQSRNDLWQMEKGLYDELLPTPQAPLAASVWSPPISLSPSSVMSDGLFPELRQVHRPSVINIQTGDYVKKLRQKHVAITSSRSGLIVQKHLHSQCQWLVTEAVWTHSQNM